VGKTYLVRETFDYRFAFQHTGILDAPMSEQLNEFRESLYAAGLPKSPKPKTWGDAFRLLQCLLSDLPDGKKVVFIDELPWMACRSAVKLELYSLLGIDQNQLSA